MRKTMLLLVALSGCNQRPLGVVVQTTPLEAPCHFRSPSNPSRVVLAAAVDAGLMLVHADGSSQTFPFATSQSSAHQVSARGNHVAVAALSSIDKSHWRQEIAVRTLDDKRLVWQKQWIDNIVTLQLGPNGLVAAGRYDGRTTLWDPVGGEREVDGYWPVAITADGDVAVRQYETTSARMGWVRRRSTGVEPLAFDELQPNSAVYTIDDRLVYLGRKDGAPIVVSELPGDARVIALPGAASTPLSLTHANTDGGWVLVGDYQTASYRVNVRAGDAGALDLRVPDGLMRFQAGFEGPMLDDEGGLLLGLRGPSAGGLYRSSDGASWARAAGSISQVLDIVGFAKAGTAVITGTTSRYGIETWSDPTPAEKPDIVGDSVQVTRAGQSRQLLDANAWNEPQDSLLSSDGVCLAYWSGEKTGTQFSLKALDVESGEAFDLLGIPIGRFDAAAWTRP